jgi:alanine racemase
VSRVERVADFPSGTAVGYGCAFITTRPSRLATIPAGYEDGVSRSLADNWEVAVRGRLAPLVGRVSMDLIVVDVTDIDGVVVGDDVGLVGGAAPAHPIEEMARRMRTIPYEVACGISTRVPRVHLSGDRIVGVSSRFARVFAWDA